MYFTLTHPKGTLIIANAQCLFVHSTHSCTRLVLRCHSYHSSVWYTPHLQHIIPMYIRYKSPTTSQQHAYWLYSCVNCTHLVRVRWSTPVCIIINWWPMQICGPMHSQSLECKKLLIVLYLLHYNLLTIYNIHQNLFTTAELNELSSVIHRIGILHSELKILAKI